jgi:hypothetical protein
MTRARREQEARFGGLPDAAHYCHATDRSTKRGAFQRKAQVGDCRQNRPRDALMDTAHGCMQQ